AANDGVSGVIGPYGEVVARAPEFRADDLVSSVTPRTGLPPYAHVGNWLVISLACAAILCGLWRRKRPSSGSQAPPTGTPSAAPRVNQSG
ncbi:MAG TPA: hypothetical protein VFB37_07490, partial [Steroidobacteraceae bacterium]|nr:hypothetical protein [Steroidobacteraceae bacterium]